MYAAVGGGAGSQLSPGSSSPLAFAGLNHAAAAALQLVSAPQAQHIVAREGKVAATLIPARGLHVAAQFAARTPNVNESLHRGVLTENRHVRRSVFYVAPVERYVCRYDTRRVIQSVGNNQN